MYEYLPGCLTKKTFQKKAARFSFYLYSYRGTSLHLFAVFTCNKGEEVDAEYGEDLDLGLLVHVAVHRDGVVQEQRGSTNLGVSISPFRIPIILPGPDPTIGLNRKLSSNN